MEYVYDMCYVCVHLCLLLGGLSIYCVLCCVWGDNCGMFVCMWDCGMSGGFVLYVVPCCDSRGCLCAGSGMMWVRVPV